MISAAPPGTRRGGLLAETAPKGSNGRAREYHEVAGPATVYAAICRVGLEYLVRVVPASPSNDLDRLHSHLVEARAYAHSLHASIGAVIDDQTGGVGHG